MDDLKRTCPACSLIFAVTGTDGDVPCPMCGTTVPPPALAPTPPAAPAPAPTAVPAPAGQRRTGWMAATLVALSVVGAGIGLALPDAGRPVMSSPAPPPHAPVATAPTPDLSPEDGATPPPLPTLPTPRPPVRLARPMVRPTPLAAPRPAAPRAIRSRRFLEERVNLAIDQGIAYLKQHAREVRLPVRYEALMGLALLECGVSPRDPAIRRIAASLRRQASWLNRTYELALAILFFDRLRSDRNLIRLFAQRLAAGQQAGGGWSYQSPAPGPIRPPAWPPTWLRARHAHVPSVEEIMARHAPALRISSDQSNTQFAVLALWVAQRHGASVRNPLDRVNRYFRTYQNSDGGWAYRHAIPVSSLANTCSGLLALAAGHGINARAGREASLPFRLNLDKDAAVAAAFKFVGSHLYGETPTILIPGENGRRARPFRVPLELYALWSVERVAVIYGLEKLGGREWYPPVAESILQGQAEDGSWPGAYGEPVTTAFALLVLRRSNLAPDLTEALTGRKPEPPLRGIEKAPPEPQRGIIEKPEPRLPAGKAVPAGEALPEGKAIPALLPDAGGKAR